MTNYEKKNIDPLNSEYRNYELFFCMSRVLFLIMFMVAIYFHAEILHEQ